MDLESTLLEVGNTGTAGADGSSIINACTAPREGIVVSPRMVLSQAPGVTASDFEAEKLRKEKFRMNKTVKSGDPIYKL